LSLDPDNDEELSIPDGVLKADLNIASQQDLDNALASIRFWGLDDLPDEVMAFILSTPHATVAEFESEYPILALLVLLQPEPDQQKRLNACISHCSLYLVEYFVKQGCAVNEFCVHLAVQWGDLEIVRFLNEKATPRNDRKNFELCEEAFRFGHMDLLRYFHSLGYMKNIGQWTILQQEARVMHINALNLEAVQFAVELGCLVNNRLLVSAAKCGDVEVMRYAHGRGLSVDQSVGQAAAASRCRPCLEYVCEHAGAADTWASAVMQITVGSGWLEGLRYLHETTRFPLPSFYKGIASDFDRLECLQYLHEAGCPWGDFGALDNSKDAPLRCLQYASENGCEVCPEALELARERGSRRKFDLWS